MSLPRRVFRTQIVRLQGFQDSRFFLAEIDCARLNYRPAVLRKTDANGM